MNITHNAFAKSL